mmetsp:Transcript_8119/g.16908  ORF Transcript_8119/g.16908 Transcript_8119/m.16908 type:complete len:144 (-) Transcript_8119:1453-1884(-)
MTLQQHRTHRSKVFLPMKRLHRLLWRLIQSILAKKAFSTQAFNFVRVETNQPKGIIIHHKRRSRREKKKTLTWWDDEVNADKPFLLRTDETPHLNLTEAQEIQSNCNTAEMLEVFEEYGEVLRKSISDFLFDWEYETSPPPNS